MKPIRATPFALLVVLFTLIAYGAWEGPIQLKRGTGAPTYLLPGELGISTNATITNGITIYCGIYPSNVVKVGGTDYVSTNDSRQLTFSNLFLNGTITTYGITNNFNLVKAGLVVLTNSAWDDLRFPVTGIDPVGPVNAPTPDPDVPGLLFSGSAENMIHIVAQHSHAKKLGTAVIPHMHIESTGTSTATSVWHMVYQWRNTGQVLSGTWTTNTTYFIPAGVANSNAIVSFSSINAIANETLSSIMQIKLIRAATDPIDLNSDQMRLLEFDIHYQIDGFGSDSETAKTY